MSRRRESTPTGRKLRRSSCGAGRSDRAGRPSPSTATFFYTQEQRGDEEVVASYRVSTGAAGVETPRCGAVLGIERRRRSARDADAQRGRVYTFGATGHPQCPRRRDWPSGVVAQRGRRQQHESPGLGLRVLTAGRRRCRHRRCRRQARRLRPRLPARRAGPCLATMPATARRTCRRSTASRRYLLVNGRGVVSVAPADGKRLWEHAVPRVRPSFSRR